MKTDLVVAGYIIHQNKVLLIHHRKLDLWLPVTTQTWHHHEKILESLYVIDGELTAEWKTNDKIEKQIIKAGDLVETENTPHTFTNHTDKVAKFLVIKQVLAGIDKREILKVDKVID
jgi:uncharacterized cupin superfamily protein